MNYTDTTIFTDWVFLMQRLGKNISESEMTWIIRIMLAAARSKKDLRRLHDEMTEPNTRLCRTDFIEIEEFWEQHFKQKNSSPALPFNQVQAIMLLSPGNTGWSLEYYYVQLIESRAKKIYRDWSSVRYEGAKQFKLVHSFAKRNGHGEFHYKVVIFGEELELSCSIMGSKVRTRIMFYGRSLTEKLTHKIVSELPEFDLGRFGSSSDKGSHVELIFDITDKKLPELLEKGLGGQRFLGQVVTRLVELGVPVTQSSIIA